MSRIYVNERQAIFADAIGLFEKCHCSTLVKRANGDMLVAFFAGQHEGSVDQGIWLSRRIGGVWEKPRRIKYMYGFIHWNPLLHYEDGITYLLYKVGMTIADWYTLITESHDFGETWSESKELVENDYSPRGSSKNKIIVRPDGTWLGPCSIERGNWDSFIDISRDKGKTWKKAEIPFEHTNTTKNDEVPWKDVGNLWLSDANIIMKWDGIIQPSIWHGEGEEYHALLRSTRGFVYRTDSTDNGESWCEAYPTNIPNNNCGLDLVKLEDGTIVLVLNPVSGNWSDRTPLSVVLSTDNGKTWSAPFHLETRQEEFSYPAVVANGMNVDIVYTHERRRIMHVNLEIAKL